ncbi:hypothetical protein HMPREF9413_1418 [Paenibacillus sp. HGF7]|nr:hypothetical protein HMPREF9413_1418 [Paenibacillus sp. HGF7]
MFTERLSRGLVLAISNLILPRNTVFSLLVEYPHSPSKHIL